MMLWIYSFVSQSFMFLNYQLSNANGHVVPIIEISPSGTYISWLWFCAQMLRTKEEVDVSICLLQRISRTTLQFSDVLTLLTHCKKLVKYWCFNVEIWQSEIILWYGGFHILLDLAFFTTYPPPLVNIVYKCDNIFVTKRWVRKLFCYLIKSNSSSGRKVSQDNIDF